MPSSWSMKTPTVTLEKSVISCCLSLPIIHEYVQNYFEPHNKHHKISATTAHVTLGDRSHCLSFSKKKKDIPISLRPVGSD